MRYPDPSFFQRRDFYFRAFAAAASQRAAAGRSFRTGPHKRSHSGPHSHSRPGKVRKCVGRNRPTRSVLPEIPGGITSRRIYRNVCFGKISQSLQRIRSGQGRPGETGRRANQRHRTGPFSPFSDARNRSVQNRAESCCQMVAVKKTPSAVHTASSSRFITRRSGFVSLRKLTSIYSLKKR